MRIAYLYIKLVITCSNGTIELFPISILNPKHVVSISFCCKKADMVEICFYILPGDREAVLKTGYQHWRLCPIFTPDYADVLLHKRCPQQFQYKPKALCSCLWYDDNVCATSRQLTCAIIPQHNRIFWIHKMSGVYNAKCPWKLTLQHMATSYIECP